MKLKNVPSVFLLLYALSSCTTKSSEDTAVTGNPPAAGFDLAHSDPAAVELADSVMAAMGGRSAWDNTRFISWTFSDQRHLVWDKKNGNVRIESLPDSTIYLLDTNTGQGRVQVKGEEIKDKNALVGLLMKAKNLWGNDSYGLVMPFLLKGDNTRLSYLGEDSLANGAACNVLQVTIGSGEPPPLKYLVYVDRADNLIKQWAYFPSAVIDTTEFVRPWDNYKKYGDILLSADRSDNEGPKNVKVDEDLSEKLFQEF